MSPDLVNGLFEIAGAVIIARQCVHVMVDKRVEGVRWSLPAFFWLWGLWNLFYYPGLGQTWSFFGAVLVFLTHSAYAVLLWRYRRRGGIHCALCGEELPEGLHSCRGLGV